MCESHIYTNATLITNVPADALALNHIRPQGDTILNSKVLLNFNVHQWSGMPYCWPHITKMIIKYHQISRCYENYKQMASCTQMKQENSFNYHSVAMLYHFNYKSCRVTEHYSALVLFLLIPQLHPPVSLVAAISTVESVVEPTDSILYGQFLHTEHKLSLKNKIRMCCICIWVIRHIEWLLVTSIGCYLV